MSDIKDAHRIMLRLRPRVRRILARIGADPAAFTMSARL